MRWSLKVGQVGGIKIFVHWTFLLLVGWIFFSYWQMGEGLGPALHGLVFVLALFACVVLHELGHAFAARHYGIQTRDITLLPIGGLARLERLPREPLQELGVALAGPAVNVVIAALIFLGLLVAGVETPLHTFWGQLMLANIILLAFNLLPAFPMDGGRILRALLARFIDYVRATVIAARIGQLLAIGFGLLALFVSPLLLFVGIFVFLGAEAEARMVQITNSLKGLRVQDAMMTRVRALSSQDELKVAATELLDGPQKEFPVLEGQDVVGVIGAQELVKALAERGPHTSVREAMHPGCRTVDEQDELEGCYDLLRQNGCTSLPVVRQGRLVGMVSLQNLTEWMQIHFLLERRGALGVAH